MEMKQKLIQQVETTVPQQSEYFIDRYNAVIELYNNSKNTPGNTLETLDKSPLFANINRIFSKILIKILIVLLLVFAPGINLTIFGGLFFYYLFLRRQGKKHKRNLQKVKNPLQSFYFLPDICHQLGKHCTTLQIKTTDVEGFTFNQNLYQQLKSNSSSQTITVTIYDQYFYDSFHLIKKQQYKIAVWILFATILIAADVVFYMILFNLY